MGSGNFTSSPALILCSGLPGAGKTTFARALATRLEFEHVESDAIRRSVAAEPVYTHAENTVVFAKVEAAAAHALTAERHALIDATNLANRDRRRFIRLARRMDVTLVPVRVIAPDETIRGRLAAPREGFSQGGIEVYERMRGRVQPIAEAAVVVDTRFSLEPAIALVLRLIAEADE